MSRRRPALAVVPPEAPRESQSPYRATVSGGCTVTTVETAYEAAWAALSFTLVHELPVLIVCDQAAHDVLQPFLARLSPPADIVLQVLAFDAAPRVRAHNAYHRTDAIAAKMKALQLAIAAWGDAVFFDADLTFLAALPAPQDNELLLSPNFENFVTRGQHGLYNAGLLWTSRMDFAAWWCEEYLSGRSAFYEQSALDVAPAKWRASYFGPEHNHGFWRGPVGQRQASSIHCHLSTALDRTMSQWAIDLTLPLRAECIAQIQQHPKLAAPFSLFTSPFSLAR
jgi:hypothetical protein